MAYKLAMLYPFSGRFVSPDWAMAISALQYPIMSTRVVIMVKGMERAAARTRLIEGAIQHGAEYVMFIDDDTAPPQDAVTKLLATLENADDDVVACGGIYTTKLDPPVPIVNKGYRTGPYWRWKFGDIFECQGIGAGCLMIRTSIFKELPKPWFAEFEGIASNGDQIRYTDDIYFCDKVIAAGKKILAHGGVLPVHYNQSGKGFVLPPDSFPLKDIDQASIWYYQVKAVKKE